MKHYLINSSVDWCDEFDMPFYEILDEDKYRIYMYAKLKLGKAFVTKGFGSNEYWEELDALQFEPVELSDIEYSIISKYQLSAALEIFEDLINYIEVNTDQDTYEMTTEQIMELIDEISKDV